MINYIFSKFGIIGVMSMVLMFIIGLMIISFLSSFLVTDKFLLKIRKYIGVISVFNSMIGMCYGGIMFCIIFFSVVNGTVSYDATRFGEGTIELVVIFIIHILMLIFTTIQFKWLFNRHLSMHFSREKLQYYGDFPKPCGISPLIRG